MSSSHPSPSTPSKSGGGGISVDEGTPLNFAPPPSSNGLDPTKNEAGYLIERELFNSVFVEQSIFDGVHQNSFLPSLPDERYKQLIRDLENKGLARLDEQQNDIEAWSKLLRQPTAESQLYDPFVEIGNAIADFIYGLEDGHNKGSLQSTLDAPSVTNEPSDACLRIKWRVMGSKNSLSGFACKWRPDVVAHPLSFSTKDSEYRPHWAHVVVPGEFKRQLTDKSPEALKQFLRYSRQVLKEQPDRRFLCGFTFCKNKLRVWHVDHSGVLGSHCVDVHKVSAYVHCAFVFRVN
jgi:hypothetical protein